MPSVETVAGGASMRGVESPEAGDHQDPDDRVADDDRAVGVERRGPAVDQGLADQPGAERTGRRRHVADDVVPGERRRPAAVRDGLASSAACSMARNGPTSLPVGEMTPIAPARMSSGTQLVNAKTTPGDDHQPGTRDQDPAPAESVRVRRQPQRDEGVADEREGQDEADRQGVQPGRREVQHQDDRQEAVAEHPERPHREQQPAVAIEPAQARDEPWIGRRRGHVSGVSALGPRLPEWRRRSMSRR